MPPFVAALLARRHPAAVLNEALATFTRTNPDGWDVADAESVLGAILAGQGHYEEAEPYLVESYARLKETRGARNFRTRRALGRILDLYTAWGRPEELERYRAQILTSPL